MSLKWISLCVKLILLTIMLSRRGQVRCFFFTMVYCSNDVDERKMVWDKLRDLGKSVQATLLICGDFNNVINLNDRIGSTITLAQVEGIRQCRRDCG